MLVYHLGITKFVKQLTGEGAKLHGGRWNTIGISCLYACESKALCALEFAANVLFDEMPEDLSFTTYEIPDDCRITFLQKNLPDDWREVPPSVNIQEWGSKQLKSQLAIKVPSVIIPSEFNFVINPFHLDFKKVRIKEVELFSFDSRIKK